ncbi:uncharacterized protein WM294_016658 [Sarcoramphus papa]
MSYCFWPTCVQAGTPPDSSHVLSCRLADILSGEVAVTAAGGWLVNLLFFCCPPKVAAAGSSWFQLVPASSSRSKDPQPSTAQPLSHGCGCQNGGKKGQNHQMSRGVRKKERGTAGGRARRGRRRRAVPETGADLPCRLWRARAGAGESVRGKERTEKPVQPPIVFLQVLQAEGGCN